MKKIVRISIVFLILLLQLIMMPTIVKADNIIDPAENFLQKGEANKHERLVEKKDANGNVIYDSNGKPVMVTEAGLNETTLINANSILYNVLLSIGVVLTVAIGGILGIKFMVSSVEEKAQVKELLVPYIIGCAVVFGAFAIWKIVVSVGQTL